jgi:Fe-S-cluster-containing hydrogenase component 2
MSITVNEARCPRNHRCPAVAVCPAGALSQQGFGAPEVDAEKCTACGKCARRCPMGALELAKKA